MKAKNKRFDKPELSVVVAIIEGGRTALETCLEALIKGAEDLKLECIVPYDSRVEDIENLKEKFQWAQFIDAREFVKAEEFGETSREHHDILRSIGLRQATAPVVALLEDHGTPSPGWCRSMLAAHRNTKTDAVGGAVENGIDKLLNWAVYYCDFGRYQNPVPTGAVEFLSDSNVSYKRDALWSVKNLWFDAFHETSVNWQLNRDGKVLRLDPGMVVYQTRRTLRFFPALRERYVWGRSFAGTRAVEISTAMRFIYAAFSFVLPFLLTARIISRGVKKHRYLGKLFSALPFIFLLQTIWACGEFVGYITGRASSGQNTLQVQVSTDSL